mmetsp:Transcript_124087/g.185476  ORF Transcript_124087/g.185476 Transcript_124087/m.185476 type:complete len:93 (+) Transcript_124087:361-639(+)
MLSALDQSKANPSLHSALSHVNWDAVAVFGHSMGGDATIKAAAKALEDPSKYPLKAALASHAYKNYDTVANKITVPAMFTTGTEDHRGSVTK